MITAATFLVALLVREVARLAGPPAPDVRAVLDRVVVLTGAACVLLLVARFAVLVADGA